MHEDFEISGDLEEAIKKVVAARDEADRVNKEAVRVLGPELGKKYLVLRGEVHHVHVNWAMSSELDVLSEDGEHRKLLLDTGGYFFIELRTVFWDDAILRLSRLTDPARPGRQYKNLSLWALLEDICDPIIRSKVEELIEEAVVKIKPMRRYRNKAIAHLDLDVILNKSTSLPSIYAQSVDDALLAVGKVLDLLMEGYTGRSDIHEWGAENFISDIERLLYYLEVGLNRDGAKP